MSFLKLVKKGLTFVSLCATILVPADGPPGKVPKRGTEMPRKNATQDQNGAQSADSATAEPTDTAAILGIEVDKSDKDAYIAALEAKLASKPARKAREPKAKVERTPRAKPTLADIVARQQAAPPKKMPITLASLVLQRESTGELTREQAIDAVLSDIKAVTLQFMTYYDQVKTANPSATLMVTGWEFLHAAYPKSMAPVKRGKKATEADAPTSEADANEQLSLEDSALFESVQ